MPTLQNRPLVWPYPYFYSGITGPAKKLRPLVWPYPYFYSGGIAEGMLLTILEGIRRTYLKSSTLRTSLPGGQWTGVAQGIRVAQGQPYLTTLKIGTVPMMNTGRVSYSSTDTYQFEVKARSSDEAEFLGQLVRNTYNNRDFVTKEGVTSGGLQLQGGIRLSPTSKRGPGGDPIWRMEWMYQVVTNRKVVVS